MSRRKRATSADRRRERREREKAGYDERSEARVRERAEQLATEADPWSHLEQSEDEWQAGAAPAHRQVLIEHDGRSTYVDEGMAELIVALWQLGIRDTVASCEAWPAAEHLGLPAYVAFASRSSRVWLATAIRAAGSEIVGGADLDADVAARIEADPYYAADWYARGGGWSVMWPAADVPAVADVLRRAEIIDEGEGEILFVHDTEEHEEDSPDT